ncbi:MAG: hypothetical protein WC222_00480 [Parachlamydiales bacterium]|jgi:hypothetical protein
MNFPAIFNFLPPFSFSTIEQPFSQSLTWVQQYFPLITPTVGIYRLAYGVIETQVYAHSPHSKNLFKITRHTQCYLPPQTLFYLHGILFGCSGAANLAYSLQHYNLVNIPFPKERMLAYAGGFFLASHLLSLIYYSQLFLCAKEIHQQEPELSANLRAYALKGIGASLAAIISSVAAFLCPSGLIFFLLVGIASLTGFLNAVSNYFSSFYL